MTQKYKKILLDYILGKISPTEKKDIENIKEKKSIPRSEYSDYLPSSWSDFKFEGLVEASEKTSDLTILYGGYITETATENNAKGIILLLDSNFKPVKVFYNYSNGTPLRYIQRMEQAEDDTFYMVDATHFSKNYDSYEITSEKRFVMINNFTIKNPVVNDYDLSLRTSYIFGNNYKNFYCRYMKKNPNSSHYVLIGERIDTSFSYFSYMHSAIIDLKINVGQPNEWNLYVGNSGYRYMDAMAHFNNNDEVFARIITCPTGNVNSKKTITELRLNYGTTSFQYNDFYSSSEKPLVDDDYNQQCIFATIDEIYFVLNNQYVGPLYSSERYIKLLKYNFSTSTLTIIYEKNWGESLGFRKQAINLTNNFEDIYIQFIDNIDTDNKTADYYIQRLENDTWDPLLIEEQQNYIYYQRKIFVKKTFNLLEIFLYATNPRRATWYQELIKEDYNQNNYNGEEYLDYNSLNSKKNEIFSNGSLVFARNLYDFSITNNYSISTIEVPNTYLNDIELSENKLIGVTNLDLVDDNNAITKNIYETLYLNYINTINVLDEDTNTNYQNASVFVNNNINTGTQRNSESSKIGKIRINKNNSSIVQSIEWQDIDDTHKEIKFSLYIDEIVTSIDFISNDETTIYCTKDTSELEVNKIYTFTQKLRIE